nr:phasin family protein [Polymorphobacter sp.]
MATAFETNPEKIAETMKAGVAQLNTAAESAMTSGKAAMEQITAKSKEAVESSMKSLDEMTDMARGNVEALLASARAASAGIESIASHVSEVSKKSFEEASTAMKAITGAKTPNEMMQLQSDFAKKQFDSSVAEMSKLTEMMMKLAGEVFEPVQNRVAIATDKIKTTFNK